MIGISDYIKEKHEFLVKHGNEYSLNVKNQFDDDMKMISSQEYVLPDGSKWYEEISYTSGNISATIDNVQTNLFCKLIKTEYWNSEDETHKIVYEQRS